MLQSPFRIKSKCLQILALRLPEKVLRMKTVTMSIIIPMVGIMTIIGIVMMKSPPRPFLPWYRVSVIDQRRSVTTRSAVRGPE